MDDQGRRSDPGGTIYHLADCMDAYAIAARNCRPEGAARGLGARWPSAKAAWRVIDYAKTHKALLTKPRTSSFTRRRPAPVQH
jgi:hypothetical protein